MSAARKVWESFDAKTPEEIAISAELRSCRKMNPGAQGCADTLTEKLGLPADSVCRDVIFNRVKNRQHICLRFTTHQGHQLVEATRTGLRRNRERDVG